MAKPYATKIKEGLSDLASRGKKFVINHSTTVKAGLILTPLLAAWTSKSLDPLIGAASADSTAFSGQIVAEHYDVGADGIKGTNDDVYSIEVRTADTETGRFDGGRKVINFYASEHGADKLVEWDSKYRAHDFGYGWTDLDDKMGSAVNVSADHVNGEWQGTDLQKYKSPPSALETHPVEGLTTIFGVPAALIGGIYASDKYKAWKAKRQKRTK